MRVVLCLAVAVVGLSSCGGGGGGDFDFEGQWVGTWQQSIGGAEGYAVMTLALSAQGQLKGPFEMGAGAPVGCFWSAGIFAGEPHGTTLPAQIVTYGNPPPTGARGSLAFGCWYSIP